MIRIQGCAWAPLLIAFLGIAGPALPQLQTRSRFETNLVPISVVAADFNRDGKMDIAVASAGNGMFPFEVQVFLGNGDGTFGPPHSYDVNVAGGPMAAGDLNHDGNPDLVIVNEAGGFVSVLLGNGDGTFQSPVNYNMPGGPGNVALGDFNGDGNLDIATTDGYNGTCSCISVLPGNGDGTFQQPPIITYSTLGPLALVAGHFNGDKNLDLAVILGFTNQDTVQILLGNGDGTFRLGESYAVAPESMSIVAADLRKDHKTDLAVAEFGGMGVAVLLGNGDGTFEQPVVYKVSSSLGVAVADVNGDGIPDLVATSAYPSGAAAVFLGKGDGTFQDAVYFPTGRFPNAIAVADFNGDHLPDVTITDQTGRAQYVLLSTGVVDFSPTTQIHVPPRPPQTVTLTNTGKTSLAISSISVTPHFHLKDTCGHSVAPGANCAISIAFDTKTTPQKGAVSIVDSASPKPQVIALLATSVVLLPSPMNFPAQKVGTTSAPMQMSVTNEGNVELIFLQVSLGGANPKDFSVMGASNCTNGPLAPGATCSVSVTFKPTQTGPLSATIVFTDNGGGSPEIATLTGTGD